MYDTLQLHTALTPYTARTTLSFSSSYTKYAKVNQNGLVTPVNEGTTTITVKTHNGKTDTVKVTVYDPYKPTGVTLQESGTVTLYTNSTLQLHAIVQPAGATRRLTWSSSSTKYAKVDQNGLVTPVKAGTVTITVKTHNGKTDTVKVKVVQYHSVQALDLTYSGKQYADMYPGEAIKLKVTYTPSQSSSFASLSWSSSNGSVATVDSTGKVTAWNAGYATITVRDTRTGVSDSFGVTVTNKRDYRAIVIVEPTSMESTSSAIYGYTANPDYDRTADRDGIKKMLGQQNFGGTKISQIVDLSKRSKSSLLSSLRSLPSQWGVGSEDVTYFFFMGHGSTDGSLWLYNYGSENQYITPSELKSTLDLFPGRVVAFIGSCYGGSLITKGEAGAPEDFTNSIINTFAAGDTISITALDEKGNVIEMPDEEAEAWEKAGIVSKRGELRTSKYYVMTAAAYNEMSWSWYRYDNANHTYRTFRIIEDKSYSGFFRAVCAGGGWDYTNKKTLWSSGQKTWSSAYSTIRSKADEYDNNATIQVYPSSSDLVIFSK